MLVVAPLAAFAQYIASRPAHITENLGVYANCFQSRGNSGAVASQSCVHQGGRAGTGVGGGNKRGAVAVGTGRDAVRPCSKVTTVRASAVTEMNAVRTVKRASGDIVESFIW
jgi:hypothetical protein